MGDSGKTVYMRLPAETAEKLERLAGEFAGLPRTLLLKLVMDAFLDSPLPSQVAVVEQQIRGRSPRAKRDKPSRLGRTSEDGRQQ